MKSLSSRYRILSLILALAAVPVTGHAQDYKVYVTFPQGGNITVIDGLTNGVVSTIPIPAGSGTGPFSVALTPDAKFAYVLNNQGCNNGASFSYPGVPATGNAGAVWVLDTASNSPVATIPVGFCPQEIAITRDGTLAYVTNTGPNAAGPGTLSVIDTAANSVIQTVNLPDIPTGLAITPDGSSVYVALSVTVAVVSTATNTVVTNIPTPSSAQGFLAEIAMSPNGQQAYVTDNGDATVFVISTQTNSVDSSFPAITIPSPWGLAASPDGSKVYFASYNGGPANSLYFLAGEAFIFDTGAQTLGSYLLCPFDVSTPSVCNNGNQGLPIFVQVSSDGSKAYFSGDSFTYLVGPVAGAVVVFDTAQRKSVASPLFSTIPAGLAIAPANNTSPGANVPVKPVDNVTKTSPAALTFSSITQPGFTSLVTSPNGPPPPAGFTLGNPAVYYHLATTASYSGSITVCINYAGINFGGSPIALYHFQNNAWTDVTTFVDTVNQIVCGSVTSLSPFAIFQSAANSATTTSISASGVTYGAPASVTVSITSSGGAVAGNVTLSADGGAASSMALTGGSATFDLGVLNAGSHSLSTNFVAQGSFAASSANSTLSVAQAPLTLTATNASKVYGAAVPGLGFGAFGFVNGDTTASLTTQPILSTIATAASGVGNYPIRIAGAVDANYTINYVQGTLTETPALLTVAANNAKKVLNAANPAFASTISGFVNGDSSNVLTANPTCTTTAAANSPVGAYPITCSGANAANYSFAYISGTLKIQYATSMGHAIQPPINADGTSVLKQGRTVPAKFSVYDANGISMGTSGVVTSFFLTGIVSGTTTATVEDVVDTNNPDTAFRWDPTAQQWIFNITTGNLTAGSTYIYTIALNDGSTIMFQYGLR